jgi:release factor glutamine methyltransferase
MTFFELLNFASKKFGKTSDSPALDAEVLLCFVLKKEKSFLFANPEKKISKSQEIKFLKLISLCRAGIPIAYLTGSKEFLGFKFKINKDVLIPRPETELLVEKAEQAALSLHSDNLRILDVGTGSGCIIVSLAKKLGKNNKYFATDISPKALIIAKKNARKFGTKISFKKANLIKGLNTEVDMIVANLPYLKTQTQPTKFEPKIALVSQDEGLSLIKIFISQIGKLTSKPKFVFLEIGFNQGALVKNLGAPHYGVEILKDLAGKNRLAVFSR